MRKKHNHDMIVNEKAGDVMVAETQKALKIRYWQGKWSNDDTGVYSWVNIMNFVVELRR